jgi:hypothetical protein
MSSKRPASLKRPASPRTPDSARRNNSISSPPTKKAIQSSFFTPSRKQPHQEYIQADYILFLNEQPASLLRGWKWEDKIEFIDVFAKCKKEGKERICEIYTMGRSVRPKNQYFSNHTQVHRYIGDLYAKVETIEKNELYNKDVAYAKLEKK